jgi:subfamily B ATP-binding cassette protein MsbA
MYSWITDESKRDTLESVVRYNLPLAAVIVTLSLVTALLEGIGLGFLLPILASGSDIDVSGSGGSRLLELFQNVYGTVGVPFTLETLLLGVAAVMTVRHVASIGVAWLQTVLSVRYVADLRTELLERFLRARVSYLDDHQSSSLLNVVITETTHAMGLIRNVVSLMNSILLGGAYLAVSLFVAPQLTLVAVVTLGVIAVVVRKVLEPAYTAGDRLSDANDRIQQWVQAGILGARTVKVFDLHRWVGRRFESAVEDYNDSRVTLSRNQAILSNGYMLASAFVLFGLIYLSLEVSALSLGATAVFLLAMFRLAPVAKRVSDQMYRIDGQLPHLVTVRERLGELEATREPEGGSATPPESVEEVAFEDVSFTYDDGTTVLENTSLSLARGELVALVGPSGEGKSTLVSLLLRFYDPDSGAVLADGTPIESFDLREWRSRVSVVRQSPFVFDATLRENVMLGKPSASEAEFERACERARVDEFVDGLPDGYETRLGDDGVRLSGGQRQRVAIARTLLKDAEVVVFDEATSDLDPELDAELMETATSLSQDAVTLVIAHRRSTIANADRVYAMDGSEVMEVENAELHSSTGGD